MAGLLLFVYVIEHFLEVSKIALPIAVYRQHHVLEPSVALQLISFLQQRAGLDILHIPCLITERHRTDNSERTHIFLNGDGSLILGRTTSIAT